MSMEASEVNVADLERPFVASERYRWYVVWLLFVVYAFNFVDRQILTILIEPIKREFALSDTQVGLLGGLAFAALYSTLGIPIARWADRGHRVNIIASSLSVWSFFTVTTGWATSFVHLLLSRICVGIGEAGCSPPAYSLLGDYFARDKRSTAISIYSMGIYAGVLLGFLIGGNVAQAYGWRAAFFLVGTPGLALALVLKLTLREPPRGLSDATRVGEVAPLGAVLGRLWSKRSFRHLSLAAALHSFVNYGVGGFLAAFLMRSHGMSVAEVGSWLSILTAVGGISGTYFGGYLADRLASKRGDRRYQLWVPALSTLVAVPISIATYGLDSKVGVLALMLPAGALGAMYLGPTFSLTQDLVPARERAVAGALLLLIMNLVGLGLGPLLTGVLSDMFREFHRERGMADVSAAAEGLRYALYAATLVNVWSALHYFRGARTLQADLADVRTTPG
jgi:MFS family permease